MSILPTDVQAKLAELYEVELSLGNILPIKNEQWFTRDFGELVQANRKKKENPNDFNSNEQLAELLFRQIVTTLMRAGFAPDQIADRINEFLPTGTRLTFCDTESVLEVLPS